MSGHVVTGAAMRPASNVCQCFYCHQPIGDEHKPGPVLSKLHAELQDIQFGRKPDSHRDCRAQKLFQMRPAHVSSH